MATLDVGLSVRPGADLQAVADDRGAPVLVTITPPAGTERVPVDICCVVDVSGSMGTEAMIQAEAGGQSQGHGLSVLDIVKHAMRTIVRNLEARDRLALVAYSNDAQTVFGVTPMDADGRTTSEQKLDDLQPGGMTNLWDGLKTGVELLKAARQADRLQHVMLFTDGLPNINPPRGILPMVKRLQAKEEGSRLPCTISTFGFGYELDSELLSDIAIAGSGTYAFIPDAGFVGTVFVNAMTNLLVTFAKDAMLTLTPLNGAALLQDGVLGGHPTERLDGGAARLALGCLQFGQTKDVVAQMAVPPGAARSEYLQVSLQYGTSGEPRTTRSARGCGGGSGDVDKCEVERQRLRLRVVDVVRTAMKSVKLTGAEKAQEKPLPLPIAQEALMALAEELRPAAGASEAVAALLEDLEGQVAEAFSREDWYTKWGVHFLPSLMCAHLAQVCNNFKDPGVQHYGGSLFADLRDKADEIFLALPPPKPSARQPPAAAAAPAGRPAGARQRSPSPIRMAAYYDCHAGCIAGSSLVRMADGGTRRVAELRKGDAVAAWAAGQAASSAAEVACVVRTMPSPGATPRLVELPGGLRITPHHPVHVGGAWRFPVELPEATPVLSEEEREEEQGGAGGAVYSFMLREEDRGAALLVGGVPCAALGHGAEEGCARHPFFGSQRRVLEDLSRFPGFAAGLVDLTRGSVVRDPGTGLVSGLLPPSWGPEP